MVESILGASWKSTLGGLALLLAAAGSALMAYLDSDPATMPELKELVITIIGLVFLFLRDNSVTSEQAGAKTKGKLP